MTSTWVNDLDYFAWEALFAVLSVPKGRSAVHRILPSIPIDDRVASIAADVEADWRTFPARNLRADDLWRAVARLHSAVGSEEFRALADAGRLLQPDPSGRAAIAWAWMRVLRHWQRHPDAPALPAAMVEQCSRLLDFKPDRIDVADPPEWQGLVEFAQGRLVANQVREYLVALTDAERGTVIELARTVAQQLGTPGDLIEVPTFVADSATHYS